MQSSSSSLSSSNGSSERTTEDEDEDEMNCEATIPSEDQTADWRVTHFCGGQQCARGREGNFNSAAFCAMGETFLVDDGCGDLRAADAKRRMLDAQETEAFATTLGDAASCAGPDGVRRVLRRMVLVRAGPAPYLAVLDVNEKDGRPFTAELLWRTDARNRISLGSGARFVIHGAKNLCAAEVLWPRAPAPQLALGESGGRPQVRLSLTAPAVETLTVFCPRRAGEPTPRFSCRRDGDAAFSVTCDLGGRASVLRVSAAGGPLRAPGPVRLQAR
ncbi:MAG: hypothetical protein ACLQVA_01335 [Candidatus Brocadiia bacterium]